MASGAGEDVDLANIACILEKCSTTTSLVRVHMSTACSFKLQKATVTTAPS